MSGDLQDMVQHQHVDFVFGHWMLVEPKFPVEQPAPPLTQQQVDHIREVMGDAADSTQVTQWEEQFATDMLGRVRQFGRWIEVSARQWETVERIEEKIYQ